jgi:hypothetical protein
VIVGYLACNRFADAVGGAHAGMTAEGDNAVLMQKVTKELLDMLRAGQLNPRSIDESINKVPCELFRTLSSVSVSVYASASSSKDMSENTQHTHSSLPIRT